MPYQYYIVIDDRLHTKTERVKENDELNVLLTTIHRDVDDLLQKAWATSRAMYRAQHAHVTGNEDEKEIDIMHEEESTPRTKSFRNTTQHQSGLGYYTHGPTCFPKVVTPETIPLTWFPTTKRYTIFVQQGKITS